MRKVIVIAIIIGILLVIDLYVYQGNQKVPLVFDNRFPNENRDCRVDFVVPMTGPYQVRVVNLGPFSADSCAVRIEEN